VTTRGTLKAREEASNASMGGPVSKTGPNYAKLAGKTKRAKRSLKTTRKVPKHVRNAIKEVQQKFGKAVPYSKRGKANSTIRAYLKTKGQRKTRAQNLFRRTAMAASRARENANFAAAIEREDERLAREAEAERLEEQAAELRRRAAALEAAAAGHAASARFAGRPEPDYAPASYEVVEEPVGMHNEGLNALAGMLGRTTLGRS